MELAGEKRKEKQSGKKKGRSSRMGGYYGECT